jgi:hypothetical protein
MYEKCEEFKVEEFWVVWGNSGDTILNSLQKPKCELSSVSPEFDIQLLGRSAPKTHYWKTSPKVKVVKVA